MKIAIISDTHWGIRNDNQAFTNNSTKFLKEVFFPELRSRDVNTVIHLGDLFDRRKMTNSYTANLCRRDFIDPLMNGGFNYHQIVGNHDSYFKNTNDINAPQEFYGGKFPIYKDATEINIAGRDLLIMPWICEKNKTIAMEAIANSKAYVCLGHLELQGFEMFRGSIASHGYEASIFDKYHLTLSGHYHHRSSKNSIVYVGSHAQFTWADHSDERGFHILDLEDLSLTFIENPYKMFHKVFYDDTGAESIESLLNQNFTHLSGAMCKLIVRNKNNPYWFDRFCESIEQASPIDLQIVEDHHNFDSATEEDIIDEAESTLDIFKKHIDQLDAPGVNAQKLESLIADLYNNALSTGVY